MKRFLQTLFSCILSLFLAVFFLGAGLCLYAQQTVCEPDFIAKAIVDSNYGQQVYEEIAYEWENLLSITGVETPEDIMAILTPETVARDAQNYICDSYTGNASLDTQQLRRDLNSKVREYAYSHNIHATPTDELEQNISDLVDACIAEYESGIVVPLLPKILGTLFGYGALIPKIMITTAVGCAVMALFLFFLQKKRQDTLYYISISAATVGIILRGLPLLAAHYDIVNRLPFSESALKSLVTAYLQALLDTVGQYGNLFFVAAAAVFALYLVVNVITMIVRKAISKKQIQNAQETQ